MLLATVHEAFLFPDAALQPSDLSKPLGMKLPRWRPIAAGHGRPCHLRQLVRSSRVPMAQTGRGGKSQHANCRHQISLTRFPTYTNHKYLGAVLLGVRHEAAAHAPSIVDATDVGARLLAGRWENQPVLYGPNIYCISALSDFLFFFFFSPSRPCCWDLDILRRIVFHRVGSLSHAFTASPVGASGWLQFEARPMPMCCRAQGTLGYCSW
ncbi:hypothetical protein JOL62DRAFT_278713 [Phyllosticta paracitricarpa]|uniref:Uncharacterized protein n=1 Tax=Phyllosticta paracitricarpa TaxID=2016321 RepID=A0ABR1MWT4_9PEZI